MKEIDIIITFTVSEEKTKTQIEDYIIDLIHNKSQNYGNDKCYQVQIKSVGDNDW